MNYCKYFLANTWTTANAQIGTFLSRQERSSPFISPPQCLSKPSKLKNFQLTPSDTKPKFKLVKLDTQNHLAKELTSSKVSNIWSERLNVWDSLSETICFKLRLSNWDSQWISLPWKSRHRVNKWEQVFLTNFPNVWPAESVKPFHRLIWRCSKQHWNFQVGKIVSSKMQTLASSKFEQCYSNLEILTVLGV